ncbi:bifunctional D-altronate/D-mannonate dehydratase [Litorilinea aerophila]|uniref:Starvation-sensing protein RspA n=1 Tax=Litorilinea aerophila TaxID=1204385 RepID=A0A540VK50_9CHLR|nr:enolase C-terminal domain-like protein [Litorilinea aerophila]MCC9075233.1 bifunctional D-altronate/D-mannonate dehydratase [Litorilinea aerophila]GIV78374.1 MAG: starvation-sensing protein RspA [Litorilinea sp.]
MAKPVTIEDVKVITTQPAGSRLVIVKVITSEPGLYGLGCATFTQRFHAVVTAIEKHLKPFLLGRDVSRIEEIYRMATVHSYWRNGPVLNNAISGVDQALWDIKGKMANMPVYDLLGGKCREAAAVYVHADGQTPQEVAENVQRFMEQGYRYIRVQMGGYGGKGAAMVKPEGAPEGAYYDPRAYMRNMVKMIEYVRNTVGEEVELLHDIHERLQPIDAVQFAKDVEPFKLFFLEDALAPEDIEWFARIREQCATPLAMGELFNNPREWQPLIAEKLIDFIRMHVSQMGGITPAREVALFARMYGVRTAWHGPGDTSPVGHAANLHLDLWAPNFGIQEWCRFPEHVYEIFPGLPQVRNGYMYPNDKPGLGIDIDEKLAAQYPCQDQVEFWTQTRWPDGSPARP